MLICLVKDLSDLRPHRLNHYDAHYLPPASPWPRQALENRWIDDTKTALISLFTRTSSPDLLANQAQGAEGNIPQHHSRPDFFGVIFQVPPAGKSKIAERRQTRPTWLAANLYRTHFLGDEPLPGTNKCPPFWKVSTPGTLGLSQTNARPATVTWKSLWKSSRRPGYLGKVEQKQTTNRVDNLKSGWD